jgi:hypothetical protein
VRFYTSEELKLHSKTRARFQIITDILLEELIRHVVTLRVTIELPFGQWADLILQGCKKLIIKF